MEVFYQPKIKSRNKKVFVPDDKKDEKYWAIRKKNNITAAKIRERKRKESKEKKKYLEYLKKKNSELKSLINNLETELEFEKLKYNFNDVMFNSKH